MITRRNITRIVDDLIQKKEIEHNTTKVNHKSVTESNKKFIKELQRLKTNLCGL